MKDKDLKQIRNLKPGETWTKALVDARAYQADGSTGLSLRGCVEFTMARDYDVWFEVHNGKDWIVSDESDGLGEYLTVPKLALIPDALATFRHMAAHWERRLAKDAPIGAEQLAERSAMEAKAA